MEEKNGHLSGSLIRSYRLRMAVPGAKSLEVTFPYEVVEREARKRNLTVKQFIELFQAKAHFDNFDGVHYTFVAIEDKVQ